MPVTVLVEPDPGGHRFQAVRNVANVAKRFGDVLLLTSTIGVADDAYDVFLSGLEIQVEARFNEIYPATREIARGVGEVCRTKDVDTVVVMDADQSLKRWWYVARQELKGLPRKPRVIFFLTRYPARLGLTDLTGWKFRLSKGLLVMLAMLTGTLQSAAGFAGRDDMRRGWLVKRARDPEICSAHSRDRAALRDELGLPHDRTLIGVFGVITERRNSPMILEAMELAGLDADLVLAGSVAPEVWEWINGLSPERRKRLIVRDGFLSDDEFDKFVASADVAPLPLTLNGPSGIMGKALAAGVPVVTAGSTVRAREIRATGGGETADLDARSIGEALRRVLARDPLAPGRSSLPPATADAFAEVILGL